MTDKFFRPMKKGEIYHKIDWEGMFQYVKETPHLSEGQEIELLCDIAKARALDNIYHEGLLTTQA
jgi:hypothetical protein